MILGGGLDSRTKLELIYVAKRKYCEERSRGGGLRIKPLEEM